MQTPTDAAQGGRRPLIGAPQPSFSSQDNAEGAQSASPADAALTAQQSLRPRVSVPLAAGIALAVVAGLGALLLSASTLKGPRLLAMSAIEADTQKIEPAMRQQWLRDVLAAQKQFAQGSAWEPVPGMMAKGVHAKPSKTAQPKPAPALTAKPQLTPADTADPYFTAMFGSASRYAQANTKPSVRQDQARATAAHDSVYRGTILHARLQSEVASDPVGAPMVAVMRRATSLGSLSLPAGTEAHGVIRGASAAGARVFVDFLFVRLPSGVTHNIAGIAQDTGGRAGIPGTRRLTRATAGSVGLASVGRAVNAAGREFAGAAGRVVGAGVEGATESGSEKAQRLDRDEYVVVVPRSTLLNIYLTDAMVDDVNR